MGYACDVARCTGGFGGIVFEYRSDPETGERYLAVGVRGETVLRDPFLNKGEAFTADERDSLGLRGLIPDQISTIEDQLHRVEVQYALKTTDMGKNVYLNGLMDRNETLFYRFVIDNLEALVPVVYTPTVAQACSHWSRIYRRQRGIYITPRDRGRIADILSARPVMDPPVIVVTDNERILGIGDQGAGGMGIPIGKLALYTAAAGIHPERCMPVSLDVGTNNAHLLEDPLYIGYRAPRLRGEEYNDLVAEFVAAVKKVFPDALLQWEDFSNNTSFHNLHTYRSEIASFNDDIQGTAAMVVAGLFTARREHPRDDGGDRIVIVGAGSAGHGIYKQLEYAMLKAGTPESEIPERLFALDSRGLVVESSSLTGHKKDLATPRSIVDGWERGDGLPTLLEVVRNVKPTTLIGVTGQAGQFDHDVITEMARHVEAPIIMPLSNPTSHTEVTPISAIQWTHGRAMVATGSPFPPVTHNGVVHRIGQANNAFIFPGVGLGVIAVRAKRVTNGMFHAAARALSRATPENLVAQGQLYPDISSLRPVAREVARAVALAAIEEGVADPVEDVDAAVEREIWEPVYLPMRPA